MAEPFAVELDRDGSVLVADRIAGLLRLDPRTGAATEIGAVHEPLDVVVGPEGAYYVVSDDRVLRLDRKTGAATEVAGPPRLDRPIALAFGRGGTLYVAEYESRVSAIQPDGAVRIVAGNGVAGHRGDGGPATAALLSTRTGSPSPRTARSTSPTPGTS